METFEGLEVMTVLLGTIARVHALEHTVHALEHTVHALTASHPYPEVALAAWDALHHSVAERGFAKREAPEYSEVLKRMLEEHRTTLATAVDAKQKAGR